MRKKMIIMGNPSRGESYFKHEYYNQSDKRRDRQTERRSAVNDVLIGMSLAAVFVASYFLIIMAWASQQPIN